MPGLLLGADKALELCQLPSMLHHENTLKPQRKVLNSREGYEQHQTTHPAVPYSVFAVFLRNNPRRTPHTLLCQVCLKDRAH